MSHFSAMLLFALCTSIVFGITQRSTSSSMVRFGLMCFAFFVFGTIFASWIMFAIKR